MSPVQGVFPRSITPRISNYFFEGSGRGENSAQSRWGKLRQERNICSNAGTKIWRSSGGAISKRDGWTRKMPLVRSREPPMEKSQYRPRSVGAVLGSLLFLCGVVGFFESRGRPEPHGAIDAATGHEIATPREGDPSDRANVPPQSKGQLACGHMP